MHDNRLQRKIGRILAKSRIQGGESYIAGSIPLLEAIGLPRLSDDLDVFHDTDEAQRRTFAADCAALSAAGLTITVTRETPAFAEALVNDGQGTIRVQWVRDSSFRFFPLVEHVDYGLALHPFDLATNKVLALAGRLQVRDWVDVIYADKSIQPLGMLLYAACGKDPGFNPRSLMNEAHRSGRYSREEYQTIRFSGPPPDFSALCQQWKAMLKEADDILSILPMDQAGQCILTLAGTLSTLRCPDELRSSLRSGAMVFLPGSIRQVSPIVGTNVTLDKYPGLVP